MSDPTRIEGVVKRSSSEIVAAFAEARKKFCIIDDGDGNMVIMYDAPSNSDIVAMLYVVIMHDPKLFMERVMTVMKASSSQSQVVTFPTMGTGGKPPSA